MVVVAVVVAVGVAVVVAVGVAVVVVVAVAVVVAVVVAVGVAVAVGAEAMTKQQKPIDFDVVRRELVVLSETIDFIKSRQDEQFVNIRNNIQRVIEEVALLAIQQREEKPN